MEYHQGGTDHAMDVATGTGQAAVELAKLFTNVRATDISETMLSQAIQRDNIKYVQEPAERIDLPDKSVDWWLRPKPLIGLILLRSKLKYNVYLLIMAR
jgi:ubiquinone/menaquinone biosynthesis C-methylase UbiE